MGMKQSQRRQGPVVALAPEVDEAILEPHTGTSLFHMGVGRDKSMQVYIMKD